LPKHDEGDVHSRVDSFANIGGVENCLTVSRWQWVFFAEVGGVVPSWNFSNLNQNPEFDLGVGVSGMVIGVVVRITAQAALYFDSS